MQTIGILEDYPRIALDSSIYTVSAMSAYSDYDILPHPKSYQLKQA